MAAPVKVDYVASWADRLQGLLYDQFASDPTWQGWVALLARQFQDLEDSAQSLFLLLDIANGSGVMLDAIGEIVGQPRLGVDDPTYKLYLFARVLANNSTGAPEQLYAVISALIPGASMVYKGGWVKQFALQVRTVITRAQALIAAQFLTVATDGGARAILEWQESPSSALFTFDVGPGYDVGVFAGAISS